MSVQIGAAAAGAVLATVTQVVDTSTNYANILNKSSSLVGATGSLRVEPLVLLDTELVGLPVMGPLLQTNLSLFIGFWLQALTLTSSKINGANVRQTLDPLNPNRDPDYQLFITNAAKAVTKEGHVISHSVESYKHALPGTSQGWVPPTLAVEAKGMDEVLDVSNLAVGKLVDISIDDDDQGKKSFPVSFRLMVAEMPRSVFHRIVNDDSSNPDRADRWSQVLSGRISFISDFLLCKDLVRARKKMLADNKNGIYEEIKRRQAQHKKSGIISGRRSLAEASNILIVSKDTADSLAEQYGKDIKNFNTRQAIFDDTGAMMMVVVNPDFERVTFYYDTVRNGTELGWSDLKTTGKDKGPSVMDIFNALAAGKAPSL